MKISVPLWTFIKLIITCFSIHKLLKKLNILYNNDDKDPNDYVINYWFGKIHIEQSMKNVKSILNNNYHMGYFNNVFNQAHGLKHTINNYNSDTEMWKHIHFGIKHSLNAFFENNLFNDLMVKQFPKINGEVKLKTVLNSYMLNVWSTFTFGKNNKYEILKDRTMHVLNKTFYSNSLCRIPIVGYYYCKYKRFMYRKEINSIIEEIKTLIKMSAGQNCLANNFYEYIFDKLHDKELSIEVTTDNIFMSMLVYDFLFNYLLNITMHLIKSNKKQITKQFLNDMLEKSLLFPIRIRQNGTNIHLLNLISSNQYFSWGPRMCVGYAFVEQITNIYIDLLSNCIISTAETEIIKSKNEDLPFISSDWNVMWYQKSYFKDYLDTHNLFTQSDKTRLYDVCRIYSDVNLMKCFYDYMRVYEYEYDVIIAPESRGYPFAGGLSQKYDKPLYLIRKEGKVFSNKITKSYTAGYKHNTEIMEISTDINIFNKRVLFIDDGIASFGTTNVCIELINELGGNVVLVIALVEHSYCKKIEEYDKYKHIVTTFQKF